jgi:hypothetical protein
MPQWLQDLFPRSKPHILPVGKNGVFSGEKGDPIPGGDQVVRRDRAMIDHDQLNPVRLNLKTVQKTGKRNRLPNVALDWNRMNSA